MSGVDWQHPDDLHPQQVYSASMIAVVTPPGLVAATALTIADVTPDQAIAILLAGILIGSLHLALAIPAVYVLGRRWPLTWWRAALDGFVVGVLPSALLLGLLSESLPSLEMAVPGFMGSIGGLAFWAALPRRHG